MNYSEYYKARKTIIDIVKEDLLGPLTESEELTEYPVSYYLIGKIYPRNIAKIEDEDLLINDTDELLEEEDAIVLGNEQYPSSMGYTFCVEESTEAFTVECSVGYYQFDDESKKWKRNETNVTYKIKIEEILLKRQLSFQVKDSLKLVVTCHGECGFNGIRVTVSLANYGKSEGASYKKLSESTFFQPSLSVSQLEKGGFSPVSSDKDTDDEMALLYSHVKEYAVGHGCSVTWNITGNADDMIMLSVFPEYELLQMKASGRFADEILSMRNLSKATLKDMKKIVSEITDGYSAWIDSLSSRASCLDSTMQKKALLNIERCRNALARIRKTDEIFNDELVLRAFQYANEAMLLQRIHCSNKTDEMEIRWYPFQLVFFLQEIESIVNPDSPDRNVVDLLWFPTGGGKTEAYLGIAAFCIFLRRLRALKMKVDDMGVSVIMRYTLRLLSIQQFERAASMICAAEFIRSRERLGSRKFGIGLWTGLNVTPNTLKDADDFLKGRNDKVASPVQITKCPWCGAEIDKAYYCVEMPMKRMLIKCANKKCEYAEGLPIHLVDDDIYANMPSFITGTVDKFAQIAFKQEAGELLGVGLNQTVNLIIQDELHLISGPLGTIAAEYEAAFSKLCTKGSVRPKIIASTATIKNAESQVKSLYAMGFSQFPPQGISINDSFFSEIASNEKKPSRMYLGIMASGVSRAVIYTRVASVLLFASRYLKECGFSDSVVDSFWTQTDYFNNLKELGSALSRVVDSVQERFLYLCETKFAGRYIIKSPQRYSRVFELTSRNSSMDLGRAIQQELLIDYRSDKEITPYDFILASNMISVGIDVPRLNSMLVIGQPLKTSEYIQSTSRVGRALPGLVITVFSSNKTRDRSFYERFNVYHNSLYKYVEPTSLTPFADRARDRALQALYVILVRYSIPGLRDNKSAANYRMDIDGLLGIRNYIKKYIDYVDPSETEDAMKEIDDMEREWENLAKENPELVYYSYDDNKNSLFKPEYMENSRFRMMNAMRNVEPSIGVFMEE